MDALWQIDLLGGLRATRDDHVVSRFRSQKIRSLLAYLAYHLGRSHPREVLIELLWPECDPTAGRHRLRQALTLLRRQLEPPGIPAGAVIRADHTYLQLNPAVCTTDVAQFEISLNAAARSDRSIERAHRLAEAVELYRGELLPGHFEDWVLRERQRLSEAYLQALDQLITILEQTGDSAEVLPYARRAVGVDPLREEAQHTLIRLLIAAGRPDAALRQYQEMEHLMARDLGTLPAPEIRALVADIPARAAVTVPSTGHLGWNAEHPRQPIPSVSSSAAGPTTSLESRAARDGRLPLELTRFFGREKEIAQLCDALGRQPSAVSNDRPAPTDGRQPMADGPRLITLTGPGGSGKTRLAIQVAQRLRPTFSGGVWFVPLLDIADPGLISDQLLQSLRLPRSSKTEPLERVLAFLSARPALLVLDNFEHLIEGGVEIVKLLMEQVETLTLLVTSRQRLDLPGEHEFPVPLLRAPGEGVEIEKTSPTGPSTLHPMPYTLLQFPSVALFLDRAQAVRPDFQLTKSNSAAVAALCARLEGLPLALELAAARVGMLTPAQMLLRIEQPFELLVSRQRGADPRHRSLRAALDWSYQLLSPELQQFFMRLSVFRGGFTLEAAATICSDVLTRVDASAIQEPEDQNPHSRALEALSRLRESSLLLAEESEGEMRYRLLETLREYGQDQLRAAGEDATVRGRHRDLLLALAERAEPELSGSRQAEWADRLETEHHNLRAALEWSHGEETGSEAGFRLAVALAQFWKFRCSLSEGRQQLAPFLAVIGTRPPTTAQAKLLHEVGVLARWQGDYEAARTVLQQSLAIGRELEDQRCISDALCSLGGVTKCISEAVCSLEGVTRSRGDYRAARDLITKSLAAARKAGYPAGMARSLEELARVARLESRLSEACSLSMESLAISQQSGDLILVAASLQNLGEISCFSGEYTKSRAFLEQSLTIYERLGSRKGAGYASGTLGLIALVEDDLPAARTLIRQALSLHGEIDDKAGVATSLEELAALAAREQRPGRSAQFFGAAAALWEAIGAACGADTRVEYDRQVAAFRGSLGAAGESEAGWPGPGFAPAWAEGRTMPLERAIAEALEETRPPLGE